MAYPHGSQVQHSCCNTTCTQQHHFPQPEWSQLRHTCSWLTHEGGTSTHEPTGRLAPCSLSFCLFLNGGTFAFFTCSERVFCGLPLSPPFREGVQAARQDSSRLLSVSGLPAPPLTMLAFLTGPQYSNASAPQPFAKLPLQAASLAGNIQGSSSTSRCRSPSAKEAVAVPQTGKGPATRGCSRDQVIHKSSHVKVFVKMLSCPWLAKRGRRLVVSIGRAYSQAGLTKRGEDKQQGSKVVNPKSLSLGGLKTHRHLKTHVTINRRTCLMHLG